MANSGSTWSQSVAATVRAELARRRIRAAALMEVLGLGRTATYDRVNGVVPFDTQEILLVAAFLDMTAEQLVAEADRAAR